MLKPIFSIIITLLISINSLFSQEGRNLNLTKTTYYKKMIHFNPLSLFVGGMDMGFEKATTNKESFKIDVAYYLSENAGSLNLGGDNYSDLNGMRIEFQYRFFRKTNNYARNLFIAPFVNFKTISAKYTETKTVSSGPPNYTYTTTKTVTNQSASTVSFGYILGYRKSIMENIYFDASIGGGLFFPVSGSYHKDLNVPFFAPYQKGANFKASFGLLIAL